jgi:hypothetical protein
MDIRLLIFIILSYFFFLFILFWVLIALYVTWYGFKTIKRLPEIEPLNFTRISHYTWNPIKIFSDRKEELIPPKYILVYSKIVTNYFLSGLLVIILLSIYTYFN